MSTMSHHITDTSPASSSNGHYGIDNHNEKDAGHVKNLALTETDGTVEGRGSTHLHRDLKSRQVAMIAIGGAIGTGMAHDVLSLLAP